MTAEAKVAELESSLAMVGRAPSDLARAVTAEAKVARHEERVAELEMFLHQQCGITLEPWQRQWLEGWRA